MVTFTQTSTASELYNLAMHHKAMQARLPKLRALIGQKGPQNDWDWRPSVMFCERCGEPFAEGQWIDYIKGHTRNRGKRNADGSLSYDPNFPGWQLRHITCPRDGNAYRLPGQSATTPDSAPKPDTTPDGTMPQYTPTNTTSTLDTDTGALDLSDDKLSAIVKAVVDAINPVLAQTNAQTQAAIGILTDSLVKQNETISNLRAELNTLRETVTNASPVQLVFNAPDVDASYVAALPALRHHNFALLVRAAAELKQRMPKQCNLWLVGPAGTGKSTAGEQLAASLRYTVGPRKGEPLDFHYQGAVDQPYLLLGYVDAHGNIVRTPCREAYEHGGVLMLDELDASNESATLVLNGPLANGYCYFPGKPGEPAVLIKRHPDCIILGTANTNGMGADTVYVGRNRLDGAFLDRFPIKIDWPSDPTLEKTLTNNEAWWSVVNSVRSACATSGTDFLVTSRAMMTGAALLAGGNFTRTEVVNLIFGSMARQSPDDWAKIGKAARDFAALDTSTSAEVK